MSRTLHRTGPVVEPASERRADADRSFAGDVVDLDVMPASSDPPG